MRCLDSFFTRKNFAPDEALQHTLIESALLIVLENSFRGGSMLEMGKEEKVISQYLNIVRVFARHEQLTACLLQLDSRYEPQQTESLNTLLNKLKT
jgi:hypothetical protein